MPELWRELSGSAGSVSPIAPNGASRPVRPGLPVTSVTACVQLVHRLAGARSAPFCGLPPFTYIEIPSETLYRSRVERRRLTRYQVWFPVQLAGAEFGGLGMTHNVAAGGMLLASSAALEPGERVKVSFAVPPRGVQCEHEGRVVRVEENPEDPEGMWPKRIAVEFDRVDEELEALLQEALQRVSAPG